MSETPQPDPREGFGEAGPAQPLPQGAPDWGPAAPTPGQVPPPVPGQAPPPIPERAPGAPSAWSQTVPATLPQSGGPAAGRAGGNRRSWLIGGGAALAVAAIVGVVVLATSGGDGKSTASQQSSAGAGRPPAPGSPEAEGKTYTKVPEGCQLIKASTIARIAPGTECKPSQFDNATMAAMITRMPNWKTAFGSGGAFLSMDVNLSVGPAGKNMYDMDKHTALHALDKMRKITDSRPLHDLGDEAHLVHAVDKNPMDLAEATVIVRSGNAAYTVGYTYDVARSGKNQQQAEDAAIAAARDVLGSLH
ncbi:hypothetical protein [Streptomyces gilvosporeus]|uniref:hypothetical protein n=1 Tax=Streptomyces gilvosporeus TaxID=553510 RepID=UPI001F18926E|nr:hypothetical protein [Streptomyces gilvosporeus]